MQTITGFEKHRDIHVSRLIPFRWDRRNLRTAAEVAGNAERTSIVLSISG